ncbi:hypothetical protein Tco_0938327 [Tanacetum coccineum]|uniref:Uncharacterized protein n=1 Tax=Tanacetum coccineum TaxID=301880 RepID=A0ABQ5DJE6_9ASTR
MDLLLAEERFLKIKQVVEEEQNQPEVMKELLLKLMNDLQILKGIQPKQAEQEEQAAKKNQGLIDSLIEMFFEIKHAFTDKQYQQEDIQELMSKLLEDVRNINEELSKFINSPSWNRPTFYNDDDEYTIIYRKHKAITPDLPIEEPDNSLSMGDEHLSIILEMEKSSVENLVPIPKSEDSSGSDSESVLPSSDDFSPIFEEKSVTFSNPLFDSNDFTSSDNELLSDEDVPEDVKIYSNPLFEFDDEYISNDVNPLFDEVLENIESKDSYVSNLDEPALLVTPLSDANEDECFDPGGVIDEIDAFLDMDISTDIENGYHDSEGDIIYLESLLIDDTSPNLPPEVFLDHDPRSLKDEPDNDDLMTEDKVFDPGIYEKSFSPTFVKLTFEDRHYFPITFVIRIFLPYLTYSVDSSFLLSSGSEDTIFDPGISTFHFSSLKPVAYENPMVIFPFFCFCPKDKGIRGESS